jgi:large subunit ribosomal protein L23
MGILKKPIITEKAQLLTRQGKYTFEVALDANKVQIAKEVAAMYGVTVTDVTTMRQIGKMKSRMTRSRMSTGRTSTIKKAIVTLQVGDVIDFYGE